MSSACGSERPPRFNSSNTSSKLAESLLSGPHMGSNLPISPGMCAELSRASRDDMALRFPRIVLNSPLCATNR